MHNGRPDVVEWHIQDMKIGHRADKVKRGYSEKFGNFKGTRYNFEIFP